MMTIGYITNPAEQALSPTPALSSASALRKRTPLEARNRESNVGGGGNRTASGPGSVDAEHPVPPRSGLPTQLFGRREREPVEVAQVGVEIEPSRRPRSTQCLDVFCRRGQIAIQVAPVRSSL